MANPTIEERIRRLETRQDDLQRMVEDRLLRSVAGEKRGWRAIVGTLADDPMYEEAMRLGREWRESQRDTGSNV